MNDSPAQVRRANVEDLPKLKALWQQEQLPVADLEKRFKEFQVLEGAGGELLAAIGLQLAGMEGRVHSEAIQPFDQADVLREKLWERTRMIAQNHGLVRLWTQLNTPFWHGSGFQPAAGELLGKLPAAFGAAAPGWHFLQLRDEAAIHALSLDKEFAMFREAERERTDKMFRQARVLKMFAGVIAVIVFLLVIFWAIQFFRLQGRMPGQ